MTFPRLPGCLLHHLLPDRVLRRAVISVVAGLGLGLTSTVATAIPVLDPALFSQSETIAPADNALAEVLAMVQRQEYAKAEAVIRDIIQRRPQSAPAHEILGTALALQGNLPDAVLSLEKAVELSPQQASALTKLGDIALTMGQDTLAQDYFLRAVAAHAQERRAHQRLGDIFERQGNLNKAVEHYQRGVEGTDASYLGVKLNLAQLQVQRGEYAAARQLLIPFLDQNYVTPMTLRTLAAAEVGLGKMEVALKHLTRATADPEGVTAGLLVELGDVQLMLGDTEAAAASYRQAVKIAEDPVVALLRLGELEVSAGEYARAEQTFKAAVAANPKAAQAYHGLGSLYGLTRRPDHAIATFQQGLTIAPQSSALLRGAAVALIRLERFAEAERYARQLAAQSDQVQDHFLLGSLLEQTGRASEAEKVYGHVLTLNDRFWPALNNLAALLLRTGKVDQGLTHARKAYQLSDDNVAQPAHTYGWALLSHGDHKEATAVLEQAKLRDASHVLTRYHLGVAYQKTGEFSAAREELSAALTLDRQFEFAADAQRRLLSL